MFIGYKATSFQIYIWDIYTNLVNTSKYLQFDEEMNDIEIPTLNTIQLGIALGRTLTEDKEESPILIPTTLESQHAPFLMIHNITVGVICDHYNLGIIPCSSPNIDRVYPK